MTPDFLRVTQHTVNHIPVVQTLLTTVRCVPNCRSPLSSSPSISNKLSFKKKEKENRRHEVYVELNLNDDGKTGEPKVSCDASGRKRKETSSRKQAKSFHVELLSLKLIIAGPGRRAERNMS